LVGFDVDDCRDPERPHLSVPSIVLELLETLDTYVEVSPSGTGYRAFALGAKPDGKTREDLPCDPVLEDTPHLEMYDGSGGRYLTVTGQHLGGTPTSVETRPQQIKAVFEEFIAEDDGAEDGQDARVSGPSEPVDLDDQELLEKAKSARNGDEFRRLWNGDTSSHSGDHSRADLALCGHLAFWTGGDRRRMDQLFRDSGLYRDKWDRDDYRERTMDKALKGRTDFYEPGSGSVGADVSVDRGDDQDEVELPRPAAFDVVNGGYRKWIQGRGDDADGYYERVTNFQLELLSTLTYEDGDQEFHLRVHPADGESYLVDVEPKVFNETRVFKDKVVTGPTVTFDGNQDDLNRLKEFVGGQDAPARRGTKKIGLHGDEFVTPEGSVTASGWTDDPDVVYTDEASQLIPLWQLEREADDVDRDAVAEILRLTPQTRDTERFLPVLGWFYAAPFRPFIQDWEGEFNLLNILGDTGSGKTTTLEVLWQLFGMDGELLTAESTPFTMLTALTSTNALPVVFDEYKPADMNPRRKDKLHRYIRTSTKGGVESKGNADLSTDNYHLNAPVCLAGEQPIQGPAEERRSIMTTFTRDAVVGDTPESRAFTQLVGGKVGGEYHDGFDLTQHALAFYQWMLEQDRDELRGVWEDARDRVVELLDHRGLDADVLDDLAIQGFQTIQFGCVVYRAFASDMGLELDETTVTTEAVEDAIAYVAGEGGGADHVSHLDRFVGLLGRAASAGYLEEGEHYTVVTDGGTPRELRVKLTTAFDQVRRYARDHDVRGEDLLENVNDYRARIRDNAENDDGYITVTSKPTWINDSTQTRCVGFDLTLVEDSVDEFELGMFTDSVPSDDSDSGRDRSSSDTADVTALEPGYATFEATVESELEPKPWLQGEGTLRDRSGLIDYVIRDGSGNVPRLEEGERYRFENARVTTNENGVQIIEIRPGATEVKPSTSPTSLDDHTDEDDDRDDQDGDGGDTVSPPSGEYADTAGNVMDTLRRNDGELTIAELTGAVADGDTSPETVTEAVTILERDKGRLETDGDTVRLTT